MTSDDPCWTSADPDHPSSLRHARRALEHIAQCQPCQRALEEITAASVELDEPSLSPERSAAIRERLLRNARRDRARAGPALPAWSGWLAAAGMAGVLLVHHGIHRPVAFGWIVAGALAMVCLYLILRLRRYS